MGGGNIVVGERVWLGGGVVGCERGWLLIEGMEAILGEELATCGELIWLWRRSLMEGLCWLMRKNGGKEKFVDCWRRKRQGEGNSKLDSVCGLFLFFFSDNSSALCPFRKFLGVFVFLETSQLNVCHLIFFYVHPNSVVWRNLTINPMWQHFPPLYLSKKHNQTAPYGGQLTDFIFEGMI